MAVSSCPDVFHRARCTPSAAKLVLIPFIIASDDKEAAMNGDPKVTVP
jgi:hypothetical protein